MMGWSPQCYIPSFGEIGPPVLEKKILSGFYHIWAWRSSSAETQSGLPLLPWSCYASVIQCDIIQYLLFLFYYNTGIISFLAIYDDTILCTIFCISERLYTKKTLVLTCYDVALLFWVFCKHLCFNVHE